MVQGRAPKQLLRSYEAERHPVAQANTALSVANWREAMKVGAAVLLRTLSEHVLGKVQHFPSRLKVCPGSASMGAAATFFQL